MQFLAKYLMIVASLLKNLWDERRKLLNVSDTQFFVNNVILSMLFNV